MNSQNFQWQHRQKFANWTLRRHLLQSLNGKGLNQSSNVIEPKANLPLETTIKEKAKGTYV